MPTPPFPCAYLSIPLGSPETQALTQKGITAIDSGGIDSLCPKIRNDVRRGLHFLLCIEGSAHLLPGAAPCQPKGALFVYGGTVLTPHRASANNRFLRLSFDEASALLPRVLKPLYPKTIAGNPDRLWQCLRHMAFDLQSPSPWRSETAALSAALSARLLGFYLSGFDADLREDLRRSLDDLWSRVSAHIEAPWGLDDMAKLHGTSARQFDRHCRLVLGQSPMRYLTALRLDRARALLTATPMAVSEVARVVGYGDAFAFSAAYKRRFGISPRASMKLRVNRETTKAIL